MWPYLDFILDNTIMHSEYQKELSSTDPDLENMTAFICIFLSVFFFLPSFSEASHHRSYSQLTLTSSLYLKLHRVIQTGGSILKDSKREEILPWICMR